MSSTKRFLFKFFEFIERRSTQRLEQPDQQTLEKKPIFRILHWLTPNGGTLVLFLLLALAQNTWARSPQVPINSSGVNASTLSYQGRLTDEQGNPLNNNVNLTFALFDVPTGGNPVWGPESHNDVPVSDGLFNVALGSQTPGGIDIGSEDLYLEINVNGETLTPREPFRSVPVAQVALNPKWTMLGHGPLVAYQNNVSSFGWQVVDLSTFVPALTEIAYVHVFEIDTQGNSSCAVRLFGSTSPSGLLQTRTPLPNIYGTEIGMIGLNDLKFEYKCSVQPGGTILEVGIQLVGYYGSGD